MSFFMQSRISHQTRRLVLAGLCALFCLVSWPGYAAMTLDVWRNEIPVVRTLADNDAPKAYQQAQHLQKEMPADVTQSDRARILNLLSRIELHLAMVTESVQHSAEARVIARHANDADGQVEAILNFTLGAINLARFDDMIDATQDGMILLDKVGREELRAEMLFQAAMMYLRFGQVEELVTVAMQGLDVAKGSRNPRVHLYASQSMATAFMQSKRHEEAGEHYRNMLEAARQMHSSLTEASALLGLASVMDGKGDKAKAISLIEQAAALSHGVGAPFYVGHAQHQLADLYRINKQPEKALPLLDDNVKLYEGHDNPIGLWWTLQLRSHIQQAMGRLDAAQRDAVQAYALAEKSGFKIYLSGSAQRLAEVAAARGDHKEAYRWAENAMAFKEVSDREKTGERIVQLAQRFREESKQREIDKLNRENERHEAQQQILLVGLAAVLALLAVTMHFLLRLRKSREEIRALNAGLEQRVQERTAELLESRQSLAEAQRIAHVGSWENNLVDNVLTWSDEIYRIFEIDPQQFGASYEAFMEAVHPDDRELLDRAYKESLAQRQPFDLEHRLLLPDGRIKYVHERCETIYAADGAPLRSIGTVQDITERKEMDNALRESGQLLADAQRIARVGSWEYDIASDTHTWSDELFRIYEINPAEGASYDGCMNATHPDDRAAVADAYLNAVETGQAYESEHRLLMKDGRIKYVHERGETICKPDGTLLRAVGMMQDITERKQVEQKLKEALEFSQGIINAMPDILFEMDRDGRYLNVWTQNPDLLAAQREMLLGKTVHEVLSPGNAAAAMRAIRAADEKGYAQGEDIPIDLPEGRRWFSHTLSRKPGSAPGVVTFLALSRDITERKELEEALAVREQEFRSLAESSPDFIVRYDREGRHRYLNNNLMRKLGLSGMEEVLGKRPGEVWTDGRFSEIESAAAQAIESGEMQRLEMSAPDENGGVRYTMLSIVPERDTGGSVIGAIAFGRDITESKHMEAALKESEARYRYHFNQLQSMLESAASVSVFALDREYRYLFFNNRHREGAKRIRGTDIEIGMNMVETIPDPEFREFCRRGFDRVLAGNVVSVESKEKLVKDGVSTYEYNDNYGSPIFNDEGEVIGLTVFAINTTERKRLEAELRESHSFLNSVIDAVPDPIFVKDRLHRWVLLNDANCRFTGLPREALIGKSDYDIFPKEEADVFWEKDEQVFDSGEVNLNEESFTSADGVTHFIQTKKTPFVSADGSQMLVGVIRDISERKQLEAAREAALAEAQRLADLRSEFIAHMSHELRTPLNGILGYAQMLERDGKLDDKQHTSMEVIRQSGEHLLALIEDILDLARIESGRLELHIGDIHLPRFLEVVAGIVGVKAKQKKIEFVREFSPGLPDGVRGDEKRLRQVLLNLLSNAVKFTDRGKVVLRVEQLSPSRLAFTVADTGIGIAPADREKIFQSFEQVGDARHRTGGAGLGLAISRQLVRLMGGDIMVESRPGEGSTFSFELELPVANIEAESLCKPVAETQRTEADGAGELLELPDAPPSAEIQELHRLALLGNMRDIVQHAERIGALDSRYRPFAEHLKRLAGGFQSRAILAFVEGYLP